jgi:hypothetical protein
MKKTLEKYSEQINTAIERAKANFTNQNLLALRISIDKYLWKKLNGEASASSSSTGIGLKELVEELPKDTSVQMLKFKMEFWKMKFPGVFYDLERLAIVREVQDGGDSQ